MLLQSWDTGEVSKEHFSGGLFSATAALLNMRACLSLKMDVIPVEQLRKAHGSSGPNSTFMVEEQGISHLSPQLSLVAKALLPVPEAALAP